MASGGIVGSLRVVLGLDTAEFDKGIVKAKENLGRLTAFNGGKGLEHGLEGVGEKIRELAGEAGLLGSVLSATGIAGVAAAAALGASFGRVGETLERIDQLGKTAQKVGLPVEELSRLTFAAELSDVSIEQLQVGLVRLSRNMEAVAGGAKGPAAQALEALRVKVDAADGSLRPVNEILLDVANHFGGMQDGATKTALAVALFGRSGAELIPLLNRGVDGIREMGVESDKLGRTITDSAVAGAEAFVETNKRLHGALEGVGVQLSEQMAPALTIFSEGLLDAVKNSGALHDAISVVALALKVVLAGAIAVGGAFEEMWDLGKGALLVAAALARGDFKAAPAILAKTGHEMADAAVKAVKGVAGVVYGGNPSGHPEAGATRDGAPPLPPADAAAAAKAAAVRTASDQAIAAASKAELSARIALTGDIQALAELKLHQVEEERRDANQKLADEVAQGKITAAAAGRAQALNDQAASEKATAVLRERDAALIRQQVDTEAQVTGYRQQILQAQAQLAGTATDRARFEAAALAAQQKVDRDRLVADLAAKVASGEITAGRRELLLLDQQDAQAADAKLKADEAAPAIARAALQHEQAGLDLKIDILASEAAILKSSTARAGVEVQILKTQQERERVELEAIVHSKTASDDEKAEAQRRLEANKTIHANQLKVAQAETDLAHRLREAVDAVSGLKSAFQNHDWAGLLDELARTIQTVKAAFNAQLGGSLGQGIATTAGVAGSLVGGKGGSALLNGAGVYSLAAGAGTLSASLGAWAAGQAGLAALGGTASAFAGVAAGAATALAALSAVALPLAVIAGLATLFIGSKPSNHAGITTLTQDSFAFHTSDKETSETKAAVEGASQAILQGEAAFKAAGIATTKFVTGLDLGTRDMTHIFLSTGEEIRSAVGDPAAAADTALKAVLAGATYVSDAQKTLVESMLAAGKGFDDIATALQAYAAAQGLSAGLADQILQLTDPKAYDLKAVHDAISAQRAAYQGLADQGYLTAAQLGTINGQLTTLEGLQLDVVLKRYATSVDTAATTTADAAQALADALDQARSDAKAAVDAQSSVLSDTISKFSSLASSLHGYQDELSGVASASTRAALLAARNAFLNVAGKGDADSLGKLRDAGQAYIEATKAGAHSAIEVARAQAQVAAAVTLGADAADAQVDVARQQLDALNGLAEQLGLINDSVLSLPEAIGNLITASIAAGKPAPGAGAGGSGTDALGIPLPSALQALGLDPATAQATYQSARRSVLGFASGGGFQVGGMGATDSRLAEMRLSPGEYVSVSHGDSLGAMASELVALRADFRAGLAVLARNTGDSARFTRRWDGNGLPPTRDVA